MKKLATLIAALAASLAFTAAPASAATPQELAYYGPAGVGWGVQSANVHAYGFGNLKVANFGSTTPAVCTVGPVLNAYGERKVTFHSLGDCVLRFKVAGGAGPSGTVFDPIDTTRTIRVGFFF